MKFNQFNVLRSHSCPSGGGASIEEVGGGGGGLKRNYDGNMGSFRVLSNGGLVMVVVQGTRRRLGFHHHKTLGKCPVELTATTRHDNHLELSPFVRIAFFHCSTQPPATIHYLSIHCGRCCCEVAQSRELESGGWFQQRRVQQSTCSKSFVLDSSRSTIKKVDPQTAEAIDQFIVKLKACATGSSSFTFILDDPAGNSFVENPFAPSPDPSLSIEFYERTREQDASLGYVFESSESSVEPYGSVGAVAGRLAIAQGSSPEFAEALFRYIYVSS
ncbi:putative Zinc finger, ZPR1-type, ZPR1, A/B domain-containing protein [Helianthus annuus]|nr:putative Zinc finger, ZPR1-type, ZPR1, A/B domain-containing protein [Helianthus annuus]KAJ0583611.1 putative Zinc finger, ZPR1-type, ZPR1, A/B domain-containing protein [Helianthus annuus]